MARIDPVRHAREMTLRDLLDLALPSACGGCGTPGHGWCPACATAVHTATTPTVRDCAYIEHAAGRVRAFPVWSALAFEEPVRTAITAWKDQGRVDLQAALLPPLRSACAAVLRVEPVLGLALAPGGPGLLVVPVPSSRAARRRRGRSPVTDLARALTGHLPGLATREVLRQGRRVRDQAHLGRGARVSNVADAFVASAPPPPPRGPLHAHPVLVMDDVVTTGATMSEAARALAAAGWAPVAGITVASAL